MSRAAWVAVAATGVICGAIALSPGPVANAEGEDDWFSPATSTSITTAPPTTTSTTSTTSTTVASTTTTEDEWLPPATVTSTTQPTTTSASTTSTTPNGTTTEPDPTSSTTSSSSSTTSTTAPCYFLNPATGETVPALPEDCINLGNPPGPTVSTVTTPPRTPTAGTAPPPTNPVLVDPSTTTVASAPAPTGSVPPSTERLANEQAAGEPPTTTGTTAPGGDIVLDEPVTARSAQVRGISYESRADSSSAVDAFAEPLGFAAEVLAVDSPSFVIAFPWDRGNPIGVELGPGRVLGAWVIWMTITLLIMAFWVPSPTRRTSRVTVRKPRSAARRV